MASNIAFTKGHDAEADLKTPTILKVGFVSEYNPRDRNHFSGTIHYMYRALTECPGLQVELIGHRSTLATFRSSRFGAMKWKFIRSLNRWLFAMLMRDVEAYLKKPGKLDILIAPVASRIIANLSSPSSLPPIFFVTDATPAFLREEYGQQLGSSSDERERDEQEREVFRRCAKIIYSSHYMADRALEEFRGTLHRDTGKLSVIPFGLNIDDVPVFSQPKSLESRIELLFIGKNWHRKGGDVAVAAAEYLQQQGFNTRLTIVGSNPSARPPGNVELIPYINKNVPEQKEMFLELHRRSTFLLLPTRADCTPMVIAEANAFGTPVLVSNVGGISSLVEEGRNGVLMPPGASGEAYARRIMEYLQQPELYRQMSFNSRLVYEEKLNWAVWANQIKALALDALTSASGHYISTEVL